MKKAGRKKLERGAREAAAVSSRRTSAGPKTPPSPKAAAAPKGTPALPTATTTRAKSTRRLPKSTTPSPSSSGPAPAPMKNPAASRRAVSDDARRGVLVAPTGVKSKRRAALAAEVESNPFRFLIKDEMELLFDLGGDVLTTLRGMGAPVVGKKMNPRLLMKWLESNHDRVPKVRAEEGTE